MAQIMAIVTLEKDRVGGGAPIFVVDKEEELQRLSFLLEKTLDANAHDLKNGTMILVKH
ncbi:capping complex subunit for YIEGIA [Paenibacillus ferrarius]|uniref:capping complex subunit for YIEGIA n=1 Tax=Paenibacillus ferrarius TaxID=1469647 RepID=UPI003D2BE3FF